MLSNSVCVYIIHVVFAVQIYKIAMIYENHAELLNNK